MFQGYIKGLLFVLLVAGLAWVIYSFQPYKFLRASTPPSQAADIMIEANAPFQEGKHYQKLPAKITTNRAVQQFIKEDQGKFQAIEFFSYACYWCHRIHTPINNWVSQKPSNVVFYRFPVVFSKGWDNLAKAFYIVQTLDKSKTLDEAFFTAIHKNNIDLYNEKQLQSFFEKQGIAEKRFLELYGSFDTNRAFARGNEIINAFQITVSPAIVLNLPSGSYLITVSMAGSGQSMIDVMNYLISRESKSNPPKNS